MIKNGWKKYSLITSLIVGCFLLLWIFGLIWFGHKINTYDDELRENTDAIVVFTGGRNRIREAVRLLNSGAAEHLFISGVEKHTTMKDIANTLKLSINEPDKIELGYQAGNTVENALEIKEWIEKNNIQSVRLITSNYHTPRSMAELEAYHLPLKIIAAPVYSENVRKHWWHSWGTFRLIFGEYNKYLAVIVRNLFKQ